MRLTFLCHAAMRSMREGGFPSPDEGIDDGGAAKAERLRLGSSFDLVSSPAPAARETANLLRSSPSGEGLEISDNLRDIDHGEWTGRPFISIDREALAGWLADPAAGTPGGETFATVMARIAPWLDTQSRRDDLLVAITHPTVIRAALAAALGMPAAAAMRIDIAPLATIELSFNRIWRLQAIRPALAKRDDLP